MDFERVLKTLLAEFERHQIRYAAIGGFALGMLGAARTTMDLDFLVDADQLETLHAIMGNLGYARMAQTENVTRYSHADAQWGALDFLHAFRRPSREILARAKAYAVFDGRVSIRVAGPEDVIGFKVQAIANNPKRRKQEEADIERLMEVHRDRVDWTRIQAYYDLFDMGQDARELRKRFEHVE